MKLKQELTTPNRVIVKSGVSAPESSGDLINEKEMEYFDYGDFRGGEALFVSNADAQSEDDGYLIDLLMSEEKAYLLIIDASNMKELAKLHLPQRVPSGVHACWLNEEKLNGLSSE